MRPTPRVSVIMPCYNVQDFLSECLNSVLNQSFKDFEIICIEDCSTDNTKEILKQYAKKHKNIRLVCNSSNQGLAISRNTGINESCGEYIYFLDSDDTISPDCLQKLYDEICKNNCDVVVGSVKVYPDNSQDSLLVERAQWLQNWINFKPITTLQIDENNADDYYNSIYCCAVNKLYKRDYLLNNDIYFINKNCYHEDNGFWLKILTCNPVISAISEVTYFYRIRNNSIIYKARSNKKTHLSDLTASLFDALTFAKTKNNAPLANFIYYDIYRLKPYRLFYLVWTKFEKRLKLFMCPIFRLKFYPDTSKFKLNLLGIPVFIWRKK